MPTDRGKLSALIVGQAGYFRTDCDDFPLHSTDRSVWYALLVVEDGEIVRYGFTSSKSSNKHYVTLSNLSLRTTKPYS